MLRMSTRVDNCRGFTVIELTMVMVVVTVLAVVALMRIQNTEISTTVEADHLARDIRHMQMLALTWGQTLRLTFPAANQYRVVCASGSATPPCNGAGAVTDPANAAPFTRDLAPGVTVAGAALDLDGLGRPVAGGVLVSASPAGSFTLSGGAEFSTVSVERLTGFVTVVY
jgi:prepilin-type N-terminal cleavage/methylation domain-containing protein